jgi:hypothetical protein
VYFYSFAIISPWIDWLIDYLGFYVPLKNFSLIWRRQHCRWRAAKFRPMLGAQGLWAGRGLYRATPAVTRDLGFSGLIRRTAPFSRLLRHTRGCGGSILARILTTVWYKIVMILCQAKCTGILQITHELLKKSWIILLIDWIGSDDL